MSLKHSFTIHTDDLERYLEEQNDATKILFLLMMKRYIEGRMEQILSNFFE